MSATGDILDLLKDRYCDELEKQNLSVPCSSIAQCLFDIARTLIADELELPPVPQSKDALEVARYQDALDRYQSKFSDENASLSLKLITDALCRSFVYFTMQLPPYAFSRAETSTSIPLRDAFADVTGPISALTLPLIKGAADPALLDAHIFETLTAQLTKNQVDTKGNFVAHKDFKGSPQEAIEKYLAGTVFTALFRCSVPFEIPNETRFSGQWVIAPPGRGKTTLLHSMFLEDLKKDASIIVMDSKGDLINPIKSMAAIADRLVLIEPDANHPLALNPLDVPSESVARTIALIEYILSGLLEAKFTNLQSALFRQVLPAIMRSVSDPTIEDFKRVLADGLTPEEMEKLDGRLKLFFEDRAHGFHAKTYSETRGQIIWRLDYILANDIMRAMFASPKTRLNIADAMDNGKIILIDASKAALGDEGSEFYQRFFLALILAAAQQRATVQAVEKTPVFCYLDECQWVRNDQKLATILDECRSQKIGLILAHQRTEQITDKNVLSAMSNCAIRCANSDDEAKYLSTKLRCDAEFLATLPRGTFATFVRDLTLHAVALRVPYTNLEDLPRMSPEQQASIRERMHSQYGILSKRPPTSSLRAPNAAPLTSPEQTQPGTDTPEAGPTW